MRCSGRSACLAVAAAASPLVRPARPDARRTSRGWRLRARREDRRLDPELRALADDRKGLLALLEERREAHGHTEGAGRSPEEIAERFLDRRAIPDASVAARAAETLTEYLALSSELGAAPVMLRDFARRRGLDLGGAIDTFAQRAARDHRPRLRDQGHPFRGGVRAARSTIIPASSSRCAPRDFPRRSSAAGATTA